MKNSLKDDELNRAYQCADHYYRRGASQAEIATIMGISRPKVSRLLALARSLEMVTITLNPPADFDRHTLAAKLVEQYDLNRVYIGLPDSDADDSIKQAIGDVFGETLNTLLNGSRRIGIGQGSTIYGAVKSLTVDFQAESSIVIPLLGGAGHSDPTFQNNAIVDLLAGALNAHRLYLMAPAICESASQKESFGRSNSVATAMKEWGNLDLAIFGLGKPIMESDVLYSAFSDTKLLERISSGTEGEILARFFDNKGAMVCSEVEDILLGIPFDLLLSVPERICLAGGKSKVDAIRAALEAGFMTTLITDLQTARLLVT